MTDRKYDSADVLVHSFFEAVPVAFSFLASEREFSATSTLKQATSKGLEAVRPENITSFFWAVWQFNSNGLRGEVRFGDREYAVSVVVSPTGLEPDFALWEWCEILGDALSSSDGQFCNTVIRLKAELERHAQTLKKLQTRITNSSEKDLIALLAARSKRMDEWLAQNRHAEHERARSVADEAFRKHDFEAVIRALEPYEAELTPAELKKLKLSRSRKA